MSRGYSALGSNASGSATKTMVNVITTTAVRAKVFEIGWGNQVTPVDQAWNVALKVATANGTAGSNPTPQKLDPADVAAICTAGAAHSAEPTYTAGASLYSQSGNIRAAWRFCATPGQEFVAAALATSGLGLQLVAASAAMVLDGYLAWTE